MWYFHQKAQLQIFDSVLNTPLKILLSLQKQYSVSIPPHYFYKTYPNLIGLLNNNILLVRMEDESSSFITLTPVSYS